MAYYSKRQIIRFAPKHAGPEISVATTEAYSAQLAAMYCLAVQFAKVRGKITEDQYSYYISELLTLPEKMQKALEDKERIQWFAAKYANAQVTECQAPLTGSKRYLNKKSVIVKVVVSKS